MPVTPEEFAERYPRLYHMAARDSWPSIRRHGLLSTTALLDLFEIEGDDRVRLEESHRPESIAIHHPEHGEAVIRDQKPMRHSDLERALQDGLTPVEWYRILNGHVFLWPTEERLGRMLNARAYRDSEHLVLTVDTAGLIDAHSDTIRLSRLNSGATRPMAHPRGRDCFLPMVDYPFHDRLRRGLDPVAEVAVLRSVPDIFEIVSLVEIRRARESRTELDGWDG